MRPNVWLPSSTVFHSNGFLGKRMRKLTVSVERPTKKRYDSLSLFSALFLSVVVLFHLLLLFVGPARRAFCGEVRPRIWSEGPDGHSRNCVSVTSKSLQESVGSTPQF